MPAITAFVDLSHLQPEDVARGIAAHARAFRDILTPITGALYDQRWYKPL